LERQSYGYGAAPMARAMFAATEGDAVKNDVGIDLAGLPADDCAICFHGLTSGTSAVRQLGVAAGRYSGLTTFFLLSTIAS
jgi:hypothetical protein